VRVLHLHNFTRRTAYELLTEFGDLGGATDAFTRLSKVKSRLTDADRSLDQMMPQLLPYLQTVEDGIKHDEAQTKGVGGVVISIAVWGDDYLDLFVRYCLPSLGAPGNLIDIDDVPIHWHVFTNDSGKRYLTEREAFFNFKESTTIRFEIVPSPLLKMAQGDNKYWAYGGMSQTSFRYAAGLNAHVHFMNPDTVYSAGFFKRTLEIMDKEGATVILSNSFRTIAETVRKELDNLKLNTETINLEACQLHSLGLKHLHPAYGSSFPSPDEMRKGMLPRATVLGWQDGDNLILHTPHYQPILVSRNVIEQTMQLSYFTVDSSILRRWTPSGARDVGVRIIEPSDSVGYFEISPRGAFSDDPVWRTKFIRSFWDSGNGLEEFGLFKRELRLPLVPGSEFPGIPSVDSEGSRREFGRLMSEIAGLRPVPKGASDLRMLSWLSVVDLVRLTDIIYGREVNNGCGPAHEASVEAFKLLLEDGRTIYSGSPFERDHLSRLTINFLRLGLLGELIALRDKHELDLDGNDNAFIDFCYAAYNDCTARGSARRKQSGTIETFVVGSIVWGTTYTENFMDINVRSMLAPGNLPALADEGPVVHVIVTDRESERYIRRHPVFNKLRSVVEIEFITIPDGLIKRLNYDPPQGLFYLHYGMLDHCLIHFAQGMASNLFMIPVDSVVADGTLSNMAAYRLDGYECCGGGNVVAETDGFLDALRERFDDSPVLTISTRDLASLAVKHAHHYFRSQVVASENSDYGIHAREVFWPIDGGLEIHSVFIHPLFTAATALRRYKRMHLANIDYGMIPRMFSSTERIKIIDDMGKAYINNFAKAERLFETCGRAFSTEIFVDAHAFSYPVHKSLFSQRQFLPCLTPNWSAYRDVNIDVSNIAKQLGIVNSQEAGAQNKELPGTATSMMEGHQGPEHINHG